MTSNIIEKLYRTFLESRILSRWFVLLIDIFIVVCSTIVSYLVTLQIYKNISSIKYPEFHKYLLGTVIITFLSFILLKSYKGIIRYSTINDFQRILGALLISDLFIILYLYFFIGPSGSVSIAYCTTLFLSSLVGLYSFRIIVVFTYKRLQQMYSNSPSIAVYIWELNEENIALSQVLNATSNKFLIRGFLSTDSKSKLKDMTNLPVINIHSHQDISKIDIESVLFTKEQDFRNNTPLVDLMIKANIHMYVTQEMNINDVNQLGEISNAIRPIQIEDLLGRPEIKIDVGSISEAIEHKVILVTGAAGSIGSEIVRQLIKFNPKLVICLDQAETPLNDLDLELRRSSVALNYRTIIGDIRNTDKIDSVLEEYKPQIVYHAAAYKHVPLMEKEPCEAVITNVLGTKHLVDLSIKHSVEMFIMVSTDKAVNPTNIMGATKRIAEIYVQTCALDMNKNISKTKFVTTRFGNVLGSNGSVIPLFKKQIERGGPITVTHKDITRYFMTIPEACRLVLQASVIGKSGYIYIFDMGDPVKIYDLATKMIELAGFVPEKDIKIDILGLRPGEKLYEELLNDSEITEQTRHEKIKMAKVRRYTLWEINLQIDDIITYAKQDDKSSLVSTMKVLVPEFKSNNSVFESLDKV